MESHFDFEKPIVALEKKLVDLRELAKQEGVDFSGEIKMLEKKVVQLIDETYARLTPWQKVQLSRHPGRPYSRDYIDAIFPDFMELHGDRCFSDDQAIIGGVATWKGIPVMILGHQKGRTTKQKMERNFGMAKPDGYRKAMRLMKLADRARMPIITLIDTPGAYPGVEAEERGQSMAIAESIEVMFGLTVPVVAIVIGEGGSGGALAIGVANRVLMQEYSTYSVISPESCASILWSDSSLAERASERLKMNPPELLKLGIIDRVIPEPKGGAHRDPAKAAANIRSAIDHALGELMGDDPGHAAKGTHKGAKPISGKKTASRKPPKGPGARDFMMERTEKFRAMGQAALANAPGSAG
jgi:acetyl-CoA carboxylase carboxyl transferase subunit alpha